MKRGGCKFVDGKTRGCPWPKREAVVSKSVPKLKESVSPSPSPQSPPLSAAPSGGWPTHWSRDQVRFREESELGEGGGGSDRCNRTFPHPAHLGLLVHTGNRTVIALMVHRGCAEQGKLLLATALVHHAHEFVTYICMS